MKRKRKESIEISKKVIISDNYPLKIERNIKEVNSNWKKRKETLIYILTPKFHILAISVGI